MEFWRFDHSIVDINRQLSGQYDILMVALSIAMVFIASLTLFRVIHRIKSAKRLLRRRIWIACGASVIGLGIWTMHFIGMLAFELPVPIRYNVQMTIISIPPAFIGSSVFLTLLTNETFNKSQFIISTLCLAAGIATMHFLGMEAIEVNAIMRFKFDQFLLTLALALLLSFLTLFISFYLSKNSAGYLFFIGAALVMALSVSGIHYAGMKATSFYAKDVGAQLPEVLFTSSQLSILIAIGNTFLVFLLVIATIVDKRFEGIKQMADGFVRAIINNTAEGIITMDNQGLIISFNPSAEKMFNYSAEEIIGKNINLLMAENMRTEHDNYVKKSNLYEARIINQSRDLKALKKDGTLFPIELNVSPMNIQGEKAFVGILRDITERKYQEQLARESKNRYQQLTELSSDWIWETDAKQRVSYLSDSYQRLTGWSIEEILGKKRPQFQLYVLDENDWTKYTEILDHHQKLRNFEFAVKSSNEDLKYLMISGDPIINEQGEFIGYRGTGTDITELVKARKDAEKANMAKSKFLSSMSHELRTPLNSILGFSQLLISDPSEPLTENQADSLQHVITSGKHLLTLINDILDLSKIESGNIPFSQEKVVVNDLLDECTLSIQPFAQSHGITIKENIKLDNIVTIYADFTRIKQLVLNLLSNAIKYNRQNGTVTLSCEQVNDSHLRITVKDTGFGIAKAKQDKMFLPFERLGAEKSTIEGTGIGLVLCKELVERMQGTISFESEEGHGSTFWIELPVGR